MESTCSYIPYQETGSFSKIVIDYLNNATPLQPFYEHEVSIDGIKNAIKARKGFNTNRTVLVQALTKQYEGLPLTDLQQQHLQLLLHENTFTITTAHQPNIFTGPLYFIYKIIHAVKLANELKEQLPEYNFVPFFYMGSEDADLEELGYINLGGEKLVWDTLQTGAVGRMVIDKKFIQLISRIEGQIGVHPFGIELSNIFKQVYTDGKTIQQSTLELLHILFQNLGLLVLIPDNALLKSLFNEVVNNEVEFKDSHKLVQNTINQLDKHYNVQASGREINLFYLFENTRERIEQEGDLFLVKKLNKQFQLVDLQEEIRNYPERFSANVILRGVFQETILPNIVFIGGGGELAYWLELKAVFQNFQVPFPVLILRNSFLMIKDKCQKLIEKYNLSVVDVFKTAFKLKDQLVLTFSQNQLTLQSQIEDLQSIYVQIETITKKIDATLADHTQALKKQANSKLIALELKMLRAEKRKFAEINVHMDQLKNELFPHNNLQERVENFSLYYATHGPNWFNTIYKASKGIDQTFCIIKG